MLKRSAFAALLLASLASGAFAQSSSEQIGSKPVPENLFSQQRMLWRESMTNAPRADVTPEQWRRARQAATMIKANRCEDAYNMALAEQDNRLALNIAVACKARIRE